MTVEQLSDYLPRYGDCLAAIAFCKKSILSSPQKVKGPCSSLRERLILKLQGKKIGQEHSRRSAPQKGNMNAKKTSKKIEIGWLHQYGPNNIKQVRSSSGGGTRHIQVDLDCPISHVLDVAKDLFFPNGLSKKGSVENFNFSITDQIQEIIPNEKTVGDYIESTKHKIVGMYILSSHQEKLNKPQEKSELVLVDGSSSTEMSDMNHEQPALFEPERFEPVSSLNSQEEASCSEILDDNVFSNNNLEPYTFSAPDHNLVEQNEVFYSHSQEEVSLPNLPNSAEFHADETCVIRIHRSNILSEMIQVFKDPVIITRTLQYIFVEELGRDAKGVSRDVYAAFWEAFLLKFTDGEDFRIPVLSNSLGDAEWESVGRILLKGYEDHKYFPVTIAPAFSVALCHGEMAVSTDILKNSFMFYLSVTDREIIESSLHRESEDNDDLLEFLDRFECHSIPTQENFIVLILQIAHRVIIQEPKYVLDSLQRVGRHFWSKEFPTVDSILVMYEKLEPTIQKVLALFKANPLTKEQNDAFKFLQKFVRGRNKTQLRYLLRFLTGSDMLCVESIEITFVVRHGVGRVPTAHTCGPVLELPSTYMNFPDFRNEWESILQGKENMHMTLA